VVLALTVFAGRDAPAPATADGTTLPGPLEDALTRLEDSVRP
jgi:hypothetical protein